MKFIELNDSLFLGKGGERSSYLHPDDNTKIIKVLFREERHNHQNELDFAYSNYLVNENVNFDHITKCFGWVDTNKGKGLVFERIENYDKSTIRTFSYYSKYNIFDKETDSLLINELKEYLFKNNILFVDASLSNIFCQKISENKYKLIIFDGLGARRMGIKFWFYLHSTLFTRYKMNKQWKVFLNNYNYERSLKLVRYFTNLS